MRDAYEARALQEYAEQVAEMVDPQSYRDPETGAVCTCGRVIGLEAPRGFAGASIPHAENCPVRTARAANREADAIARKARDAEEARRDKTAREERQRTCVHSWYMLSHEERMCRKCGAVDFIPDWD